jgi:hypothetical protein
VADVNLNFKISFGNGDPAAPVKEVTAQVKGLEGVLAKLKTSAGEVFKGAFGADLATKGIEKLGAALGEAVSFVSESIAASQEAEKAQVAFAFAVADTSKNVSESVKEFSSFAEELSNATAVEDDAIVKAGALIGQLTKLSDAGLKNATKAAVDLSVALGVDLETAAQQVAKAANGNVASFQKLGIEIKKGNTDAETFANTLKALASFQGAAAAQAQTFGGATSRLSNAFGNFKESLGDTITKNQSFVNVINVLGDLFVRLTEYIKANSSQISAFFASALSSTLSIVAGISGVLDGLVRIFTSAFHLIEAAVLSSVSRIIAPFTAFSQTARDLFAQFSSESTRSIKQIGTSFTEDSKIGQFTSSVKELKSAAEQGFGQVAKSASDTIKPINGATSATKELTEAQKKLAEEGARITADKVKKALPELNNKREIDALKAAYDQKLITDLEYIIAKEQLQTDANTKQITDLLTQNEALAAVDATANAEQIAANQAKIDQLISQEELGSAARLKLDADAKKQRKALQDQEEASQKARLQSYAGFFGNLATLQQTNSQELFAIGKAAALAQATIQGYVAVQGAYKEGTLLGGPVLGAIFAAAAAVATGVNIAKIGATHLASGIDSVPAGFQNDNFPALLQTGERVVPSKTNEDLTAFLATRNNDTALLAEISAKLDRLSPNVSVQIGEKEVFGVIRDGLNAGRAFA